MLALIAWVAIGAAATALLELPTASWLSIAFFVVFFLGFVTYYWRMAYVVDERGVTYRGPTEEVRLLWEDIDEVRQPEVPLGGYTVVAGKGAGLVLSKWVGRREDLVDIIVARAGLWPSAK